MDERQNQILFALREITEEVSAQSSLEKAVEVLVSRIRKAIGSDCCSLYICDNLREKYRLVATDGLSKNAVGKVTLNFKEGLVGVVGSSRKLLDLADAPSHPNFKYMPDIGEDAYHSFLGVPVMNQGQLLGVLVIQSKEQRQFGFAEESFMVTLSAQIGSIIARSKSEKRESNVTRYRGTSGTGDLAVAHAFVWRPDISFDEVKILHTEEPVLQQELFQQAIFQLQIEMDRAALNMRESDHGNAAFGYISSYGKLLDDENFMSEVDEQICSQGLHATSAVKQVIEGRMNAAKLHGDDDLCADLKDFGQVLISRLIHASRGFDLNDKVILVTESLPAVLVAEMPREKIAGFVVSGSLISSHAAILARDLNIPAVMGVNLDLNSVDGHMMIVDGKRSEVLIDPPQSVVDEFLELQNQTQEQSNMFEAERKIDAETLDGKSITVQLNAGLNSSDDADISEETDGIGLYRSEIAFMLTKTFPPEDLQYAWYCALLEKFKNDPVCIRTLDIGSDKCLPYLPINEINPALGWRGIRISLDEPHILHTQLRALVRAQAKYKNLEIMIPMVSSLDEVEKVKNEFAAVCAEVQSELKVEFTPPRFGMMIEVPSVVYMLDEYAPLVDFFSIGSNDLIQYLLAVDRSNPKVGRFYDFFHPSVVRCLKYLVDKSRDLDKPLSICGELAGMPLGAMMLLSLGYDRLSMNYSEIAKVKFIIRRVSAKELASLCDKAIKMSHADEIYALYENYAKEHGLGEIIALDKAKDEALSAEYSNN